MIVEVLRVYPSVFVVRDNGVLRVFHTKDFMLLSVLENGQSTQRVVPRGRTPLAA